MMDEIFQLSDLQQFRDLDLNESSVLEQLEILQRGVPFLRLKRPCRIGDGIRRFSPQEKAQFQQSYSEAREAGRTMKFVPASGAASRMFQDLLVFLHSPPFQAPSPEVLRFFSNIEKFAFAEALREKLRQSALSLDLLVQNQEYRTVLDFLLTERGLNYSCTPKGLVLFHRYPDHSRTACEEQLVEGFAYLSDNEGCGRFHFTVSPEHEPAMRYFFKQLPSGLGGVEAKFEIELSAQHRSYNTLASDLEGRPFRDAQGKLLFRPGGHGALLQNLQACGGDLVFIQNIDNVAPESRHAMHHADLPVLGGLLADLQRRCYQWLGELRKGGVSDQLLEEASGFLRDNFYQSPPPFFSKAGHEEKVQWLTKKLHRPIRVCGMVKNRGEMGGGPFWVESQDGSVSLQIVEASQVDPLSEGQQEILRGSTHFNPVQLACSLKDEQGRLFDLKKYRDPQAVFISKKSYEGRPLLALEWPGLWNGAMADWNTVFVEVAEESFSPVKTVFDLLKPEHIL